MKELPKIAAAPLILSLVLGGVLVGSAAAGTDTLTPAQRQELSKRLHAASILVKWRQGQISLTSEELKHYRQILAGPHGSVIALTDEAIAPIVEAELRRKGFVLNPTPKGLLLDVAGP